MEMTTTKTILEMKGISKAFPGVQALTNANLVISEGEIHGLVGKNGAGKSTLMAVLMGLQQMDEGSLTINGKTFSQLSPHDALTSGIAYVPQHVNMMDALTVAENILAGEMPVNSMGFVNWKHVFIDAEKRLRDLGLNLDVTERVEGLGVAEQTMLAIAKALFSNARLIILDEPTAALPRADIDRLFGFVRSLKKRGVAFVYISHHLEEVFEICDRVTIMRNGQIVTTTSIKELTPSSLIRLMVGEDVKEFERRSGCQDDKVMEIRGLTKRGQFEDFDLSLCRGEVVGISGLEGSGASNVGKVLFGLERRGLGTITINGKPFTATTPTDALKQGVAYLPQDRYRFGLVGGRPIRENVTYPIIDRLINAFKIINAQQERKIVEQYIEDLGIVTPSQEQQARLLSGGNQQKVVFAKLASTKPSVLVLHEPTQGIDVRAKTDIYRIVDELSKQGVALIIISTEVRELLGVCDRILVMYGGRVSKEFKVGAPDCTPQNLLLAIEGGGEDVK